MHQSSPISYEAYLRAQLEQLARMVNAHSNPTRNSMFAPVAPNANDASYALGSNLPVKINIEYTLPGPLAEHNFAQLPFASPFSLAPMRTSSGIDPGVSALAPSPAGNVVSMPDAHFSAPPPTTTTATVSHRQGSILSATLSQPSVGQQQQPAPRPDNALMLPHPAALREAAERTWMRQAAAPAPAQIPSQEHLPPRDQDTAGSREEPMQVDENTQPALGPTAASSSSSSPAIVSDCGPATAQSSAAVAAGVAGPVAAAAAAVTVKPEQTKTPGKKSLHPTRHRYKIRNTKHYTRWYATKSTSPIPAPPDFLRPTHGFLYVHAHRRGAQMWMYVAPGRVRRGEAFVSPASATAVTTGADTGTGTGAGTGTGTKRAPLRLLTGVGVAEGAGQDGRWVKAEEGLEHPVLEGYVLRMTEEDEPRWVKRASAQVYVAARRSLARERERREMA